jgi:signal transduction histidine kinase
LGLALVKSMVEHVQGTIAVTSNPVADGISSTSFTVTIPTEIEQH